MNADAAENDGIGWGKPAIIAGAYLLAMLAAWAAMQLIPGHPGGGSDGSDGMRAFGDSLLFLALFSVAAALPTGMALHWLRPFALFWRVSSLVALALAFSGVLGVIIYVMASSTPHLASLLHGWAVLASVRMLISPFLAGTMALFWLLSPARRTQASLLIGALAESGVTLYACLHWFARVF